MKPTASVIVCTRNRAESLEGCLRTVLAERPARPWELILVDNASTDDTASIIDCCIETTARVPVKHLTEERLGLSYARNLGVAAARGDLLLFTDDDVLVEPGWIDALCAGFEQEDVAAVGGQVLPEWPHDPPRWLRGRHTGILALTDFGDASRDLLEDDFPVGANMAIRSSLVAGDDPPFDVRLGHQGSHYFAYEEFELFLNLRKRGRLIYRPDAVVRHKILPERMTWKGMRKAIVHNGYGSRRAERLRGGPRPGLGVAAPALVLAEARALRQSRRNGERDDVDPDAAFEEFRYYWEAGRWVEVLFGDSRVAFWLLGRFTGDG